jgi:hypothetical protein
LGQSRTEALSHERYSSSPSKTLRAARAAQFGSRVFSAVPKTVRLKGSPVNIAPRVAKAKEKEKPAG